MKAYEKPTIETLGGVTELTAIVPKCSGSGDATFPTTPETICRDV